MNVNCWSPLSSLVGHLPRNVYRVLNILDRLQMDDGLLDSVRMILTAAWKLGTQRTLWSPQKMIAMSHRTRARKLGGSTESLISSKSAIECDDFLPSNVERSEERRFPFSRRFPSRFGPNDSESCKKAKINSKAHVDAQRPSIASSPSHSNQSLHSFLCLILSDVHKH